MLLLCNSSLYAAVVTSPSTKNLIDEFFSALPGSWDGQAVETPVGPVDYAIHFHTCDKMVNAGVAELNVSDHHWRFWRDDGELRLTFLSTFRGNQEPTQLRVSETEQETIWFHAPELALLSLSLTLNEPHLDIRVYHHDKPHVYIRLTRSDLQPAEAAQAINEEKSCRTL